MPTIALLLGLWLDTPRYVMNVNVSTLRTPFLLETSVQGCTEDHHVDHLAARARQKKS